LVEPSVTEALHLRRKGVVKVSAGATENLVASPLNDDHSSAARASLEKREQLTTNARKKVIFFK